MPPPQYDDQTDKLISQIQTDVDTQFVSLITLDHKISRLSGKPDPASVKALADAKTKAGFDANPASTIKWMSICPAFRQELTPRQTSRRHSVIGAKPRARVCRVLPNASDQVNNANEILGLAPIRRGAGVL